MFSAKILTRPSLNLFRAVERAKFSPDPARDDKLVQYNLGHSVSDARSDDWSFFAPRNGSQLASGKCHSLLIDLHFDYKSLRRPSALHEPFAHYPPIPTSLFGPQKRPL